jgi:hypothetical protein
MRCREKISLLAAEIRFLESEMRITKRDKIRNYDIRSKLHVENLNDAVKYRENKKIRRRKQMIENRIPRKMMDYQLQGIRYRGRPRNRWQEQTRGTATGIGV